MAGLLAQPNASHVAGFRTWNQLGRFVKKGEKGIAILAPMLRRTVDSENDSSMDSSIIIGFRAAYVFDISQTDGQELPQIGVVHGDPDGRIERLHGFAAVQNIAVECSEQIAPARGTSYGGRIAMLPGQSPAEEFSTFVHELAHELLPPTTAASARLARSASRIALSDARYSGSLHFLMRPRRAVLSLETNCIT
jgi:antirestriction protein ArdC